MQFNCLVEVVNFIFQAFTMELIKQCLSKGLTSPTYKLMRKVSTIVGYFLPV